MGSVEPLVLPTKLDEQVTGEKKREIRMRMEGEIVRGQRREREREKEGGKEKESGEGERRERKHKQLQSGIIGSVCIRKPKGLHLAPIACIKW